MTSAGTYTVSVKLTVAGPVIVFESVCATLPSAVPSGLRNTPRAEDTVTEPAVLVVTLQLRVSEPPRAMATGALLGAGLTPVTALQEGTAPAPTPRATARISEVFVLRMVRFLSEGRQPGDGALQEYLIGVLVVGEKHAVIHVAVLAFQRERKARLGAPGREHDPAQVARVVEGARVNRIVGGLLAVGVDAQIAGHALAEEVSQIESGGRGL